MTPFVYIVDDDPSVLRSLTRVIATAGHLTATYTSAEDFLKRHDPDLPGCALVDLGLPGLNGFAVQQALAECERPVVFLTGTGSIPACARAMKAGAVDFLTKPVDATQLLFALSSALAADAAARASREEQELARQRLASLTPREREVFEQVVQGRLNKQIAYSLGTALKTVKVHRGRMMTKMGVRSVAELVQITRDLS